MAINFSDTLASINADLNRRTIVFAMLLGVLLLLWFGWLFLVPLSITKQAVGSFDSGQPAIAITTSVDGRIEQIQFEVGDHVNVGDPLVVINAEDEQKQISALKKSLNEQGTALVAMDNSHTSDLQSLMILRNSLIVKAESARAQLTNAQVRYEQQKTMVGLLQGATNAVSKIEIQKEHMQLQKIQEHLLDTRQLLKSIQAEQQQAEEREVLFRARFAQDIAYQHSKIATIQAELAEQEQAAAHKILRAPKAARVAEIMPLQQGQWITAGTTLATLIPEGELRVIAQFNPVDAQGYLQMGQTAKIQVDSFPWLQYGALHARVVQVNEAERNGSIRVLLALTDKSHLALQQGMTAKIIVNVAAATPWELLLQSLGRTQEKNK
jgi:membrane fusion protein (multidrug efflux system)